MDDNVFLLANDFLLANRAEIIETGKFVGGAVAGWLLGKASSGLKWLARLPWVGLCAILSLLAAPFRSVPLSEECTSLVGALTSRGAKWSGEHPHDGWLYVGKSPEDADLRVHLDNGCLRYAQALIKGERHNVLRALSKGEQKKLQAVVRTMARRLCERNAELLGMELVDALDRHCERAPDTTVVPGGVPILPTIDHPRRVYAPKGV